MIHDACFHLDQSQANKEIPVPVEAQIVDFAHMFFTKIISRRGLVTSITGDSS